MHTVVLIGVGGIGFRHFQALFNCNNDIEIYVVDVNLDALDSAKQYGDSIEKSNRVIYTDKLDDVPEKVNVAIIATPSLPRKRVFDILIQKHKVDNVIFEKFMFPQLDDYRYVEELLNKAGTKAYVDCPARIYDVYNMIKKECVGSKFFNAYIKGSNWGLACNAIHFVDQIAYISGGDTESVVCTGLLDDEMVDSKRRGYKEFYGTLVGCIGNEITFSISCDHGDNPLVFECYSDKAYYRVSEVDKTYTKVLFDRPDEFETVSIDIPYVSQITNLNVDSILNGEKVYLPTYNESKPLHESLLTVFLNKMNEINNSNEDLCPIT